MATNEKIEALLVKARAAQAIAAEYTQEQVDHMVKLVALRGYAEKDKCAELCVQDTGKGTIEFKRMKMIKQSVTTYRFLKGKKSVGLIEEDDELKLKKYAKPVGVLACVTPVTNPAATPLSNGMHVLKTRNAMIVCPHPGAKQSTKYVVDFMREELENNGYPADLIQIVPDNTMQDTADLMAMCDLVIATGGPGMVHAAYSSGKPALGVGQGNVQCLIDEDYDDFEGMVATVLPSRLLDYGMPCTGEQTMHCPAGRVDELIDIFRNSGCYIANEEEVVKLREGLFINGMINRNIVGQPAWKMAEICGFEVPEDTRLIISLVDKWGTDDVLAKEILGPYIRILPYDNFEDAVERARTNLFMEGAGHSSCIFSNNPERIDWASVRVPAGRLMVNQNAAAGAGGSLNNGLDHSASLGCGYWGGNSIYENLTYKHMLNYTVTSSIIEGVTDPTPEEVFAD